MTNFLLALYFFGPLVAASYFVSGTLMPAAFVVAFYGVARPRSIMKLMLVGSLCLSLTILTFHSTVRGSLGEFALHFIAAAIPFGVQSIFAWACVWSVKRFDHWLESKVPNAPNQ